MRKFVLGLIVGLLAIPLGVYFYFASGSVPVATSAPPMPFERKLAHMALEARIEKEAPKSAPIAADEAAYTAGAQVYKDHCAVCHGLPGHAQTAIAKGMFPKPPKLMEGMGVTDDPAGETYWKVSGGIRMTGMPGFEKSLTTTQMWQVSLLLANADKLPKSVTDSLSGVTSPMTSPDVKK
ncbi:MAG TPA: c-type cytochrome [Terriglobales bacterium]|nr:c-type cytochrome [Terriglobales bacterium]